MKLKLKALGVGLLAALAVAAVAVVNASATAGGHFVTDVTHADIKGFNSENHPIHFIEHGVAGEVGCTTDYKATMISATKTVSELVVTPSYDTCYTTGTQTVFPVHINGCTYKLTVAANTTDNTEQTAHVVCPGAGALEVTHPNCILKIGSQTITTGITYTRKSEGKHFITMDVNAQISTTLHGLCQFVLPTNKNGTIKGTIRVRAYEQGKPLNEVNLTAT
jgi:hypothetical protein